jgi:hypothetical protein
MTTDIIAQALEASRPILEAARARTVDGATHQFVQILNLVPDYPPSTLTVDEIQVLRSLAETVIEQIEARLVRSDRSQLDQDLAAGVYAIRRALEEIDRWQRHYAVH